MLLLFTDRGPEPTEIPIVFLVMVLAVIVAGASPVVIPEPPVMRLCCMVPAALLIPLFCSVLSEIWGFLPMQLIPPSCT